MELILIFGIGALYQAFWVTAILMAALLLTALINGHPEVRRFAKNIDGLEFWFSVAAFVITITQAPVDSKLNPALLPFAAFVGTYLACAVFIFLLKRYLRSV